MHTTTVFFCSVLTLLGVGPVGAFDQPFTWGDPYTIVVPEKGELYAVNGEVLLVHFGPQVKRSAPEAKGLEFRELSYLWFLEEKRGGRTIRVKTTDKYNGWYLSGDPQRKRAPVFLSEKPVPGSYWRLNLPDRPVVQTGIRTTGGGLWPTKETVKFLYGGETGVTLCTGYRLELLGGGELFKLTLTAP